MAGQTDTGIRYSHRSSGYTVKLSELLPNYGKAALEAMGEGSPLFIHNFDRILEGVCEILPQRDT